MAKTASNGNKVIMFMQVPIFGGCGEPMIDMPHATDAAHYHGTDGLGDAPLVYPERTDSLIDHVQVIGVKLQ